MKRLALAAVAVLILAGAGWAAWAHRVAWVATQVERASLERKNGQWAIADKTLEGLPDVVPVQIERAELLIVRGDLKAAHALLAAEVAKAEIGDAHFWARFGFVTAMLGDLESATASLTRAVSLSPPDLEAAEHLVQLIKRGEPSNADAALQNLEARADQAAKRVFRDARKVP